MKALNKERPHAISCAHCGLPVPGADDTCSEFTPLFCCKGCAVVYQCIQDNNLSAFYDIRERVSDMPAQPAAITTSSYTAFDDPLFYKAHVTVNSQSLAQITFYLPDMHCAACVWLLEKLPEIHRGVCSAEVVFGRSLVHIQFDPIEVQLSEIAGTLNHLGYPPKPLQQNGMPEGAAVSKTMLIRLGVAGVAAGNSMMLAISLYQGYFTGMEERYRIFFEWVSLLITTPAVFYSAMPFYRAALQGIRRGILHIDLPISIGILGGYAASVAQLLRGDPHIYFDSIAMLIFLLLGGRIIQRASINRSINTKTILSTFMPIAAKRINGTQLTETYIEALRLEDCIQVSEGEVIPADGITQSGQATIDCALLTGESTPLTAAVDTPVFAGTTVLSGTITIRIAAVGRNTRLGRLMELIEQADSKKTELQTITDRISGIFVFVVILLATISAIYFLSSAHWSVALERTLALLIVSCPCALGMAAPLAFATAIRRAATHGVLVRDAGALEVVANASVAVFDKTGTLTKRIAPVIACYRLTAHNSWAQLTDHNADILRHILALEQQISHPIASSIVTYLRGMEVSAAAAPERTERIAGTGVIGQWNSKTSIALITPAAAHRYLQEHAQLPLEVIERFETKGQTVVLAIENHKLACIFAIDNPIKDSARELIRYCTRIGVQSWLISGDTPALTEKVGEQLGIAKGHALGGFSPEAKVSHVEAIKKHSTILMVGDGANDAGALRAADVGVAMGGGAELSLAAAPIFLATDEPRSVMELIAGAKNTITTVRLNIAISICYNALGATLAILGHIDPLVAAVLMPLSSLSVVAISLLRPSFHKIR